MTTLLFKELEAGIGMMLAKGGPGSGRHPGGGEIKVGDTIHFKRDFEQSAKVEEVKANDDWRRQGLMEHPGKSYIVRAQDRGGRTFKHEVYHDEVMHHEPAKATKATHPLSISSETDVAAHAAATSPLNLREQPTDKQKDSGNYKKGHVTISGLHFAIENPQGSTRYSKADVTPPWESEIKDAHYGYLKGVVGQDKDHLDVFLKPATRPDFNGDVYIVHQIDQDTGNFDEHKTLLGYASKKEAIAAYKANYPDGWKVGRVETMSMPEFKKWISSGSVVQRLFGSPRSVQFVQPAPFLSKGGPGSGRYPAGSSGQGQGEQQEAGARSARTGPASSAPVHTPTVAPTTAQQATANAQSASATANNVNTPEAHQQAAQAHTQAAQANTKAGKHKQAAQHQMKAARHKVKARQAKRGGIDFGHTLTGKPRKFIESPEFPSSISKDVTTASGLSTPQAGLTHYDRRRNNETDIKKKLIESDSDKAFSENVKISMDEGKSQEQALAIAYSIQRKVRQGK